MAEPVLETERLILRPPRRDDLEPMARMLLDPEVMRHMGGIRPPREAWSTLAVTAGSWAFEGFGTFTVVEKTTGRVLGMMGPWMPPDWPGPEVGWMFAREAWGQGYAAEAGRRAVDWVFEELRWRRVIHIIKEENRASQVLAERLGARRAGMIHAPGTGTPETGPDLAPYWEQSRAEWRAARDSRGASASGSLVLGL